jgi:hypothetical protein
VQGVLGKILANNSLSFANFSNLEESDHNFLADIVDGNDTEVRKVLKEELLNVMSDQKGGIIFPQIILDVLVRDFFECFLCKLFDEKELSNLPLTLSFNAGADHNTGHSNPTEKTLFFIIEKCKGLQKIVLHVCKKAVTDKLMLELGKLGNYPNLEYLELSYSCYNLTDESHLDNLATNCKKLKYIHMNHCDSCPTAVVTDAFMAALADNCPDLEVLNINYSWQNLKEKSSITGLSQCKKLKSWHLAKHTGTITLDITLEMIAELLKGCQKLRFIELHETSIDTKDGEGEKALLELLKNMGRKGIIIRGVNINIVDGVKEIK